MKEVENAPEKKEVLWSLTKQTRCLFGFFFQSKCSVPDNGNVSVNIRKKIILKFYSRIACYLFYSTFFRLLLAKHSRTFLYRVVHKSSDLTMFSGTLQSPSHFLQGATNECPLKRNRLSQFPEANTMVFSTREETLASQSGFWVAANMTHC